MPRKVMEVANFGMSHQAIRLILYSTQKNSVPKFDGTLNSEDANAVYRFTRINQILDVSETTGSAALRDIIFMSLTDALGSLSGGGRVNRGYGPRFACGIAAPGAPCVPGKTFFTRFVPKSGTPHHG